MKKQNIIGLFLFYLIFSFSSYAYSESKTFRVNKKYINIPVSKNATPIQMSFELNGEKINEFYVRLAKENPDYWIFYEISSYKNKLLKINASENRIGFSLIYIDNEINGNDSLYSESYRPQLHFTTRRGWSNDPNGFIYYNNEYHLFYQHNPNDVKPNWELMYWGHAVSTDLIHWEELPITLIPEKKGSGVFTGSAVVDYNNSTGFGNSENKPMVLIYSENNGQNLAYSLDNGRTFVKYKKNPVHTGGADPYVFWHNESNSWVMVVMENDGNSIYTSKNLKDWIFQSHIPGFFECPQLFELPLDGDRNNTKWIMHGGSATYIIGNFDGKQFTPETSKYYYCDGTMYAPQICANMKKEDGRTIQIGWGRIEQPNMAFNQMMLVPTELRLCSTNEGPRLFSLPVRELDDLIVNKFSRKDLTVETANQFLQQFRNEDYLRIKTKFKLDKASKAGLNLMNQAIIDYNLSHNKINNVFYVPENPISLELTADIIIDKTSIEVYIDNGRYSYSISRNSANKKGELNFWSYRCNLKIIELEVFKMKSAWQ